MVEPECTTTFGLPQSQNQTIFIFDITQYVMHLCIYVKTRWVYNENEQPL